MPLPVLHPRTGGAFDWACGAGESVVFVSKKEAPNLRSIGNCAVLGLILECASLNFHPLAEFCDQ